MDVIMKYVKAVLFVLVSMIVLFLVVAIFMPSEFKLERTITIDCPADFVFWQAADLDNFNKWNTWYEEEPSAYKPIQGNPGLGQVSEWSGKEVGTGKLTNTVVTENSYIEQKLEFTAPFESTSKVWFNFSESQGKTTVVWGVSGDLSYPIERFMKVKIESGLSDSFNHGLANLKKLSESTYKKPIILEFD